MKCKHHTFYLVVVPLKVVEVRERVQPEVVWEKRAGLESFAS